MVHGEIWFTDWPKKHIKKVISPADVHCSPASRFLKMSAQLSARRALRSSRRNPAVVRQLRLDIDAELDPARPPSAPSAAAAAPAAAAAVVGAAWLYDSDFGATSDDSDDDFRPQDVSMESESDSELDDVSLHDSSLDAGTTRGKEEDCGFESWSGWFVYM